MTYDKSEIGEQAGRMSPLTRMFTLSALAITLLSVPVTALGATKYLRENADDFIEKTEASYGQMIDIAALLHDYDRDLITAVIIVESEGNEVAVSNKGAKGLMQLMPLTAKAMGAKDPKDPFQNILAGTKYLKELEGRYGFKSPQEALVAYNMGPTRARRWLSEYTPEEYGYVKKVMYVYSTVLEQREEKEKLAKELEARGETIAVAKPLMVKPKSISLAELKFTLPSSRRDEVVTE